MFRFAGSESAQYRVAVMPASYTDFAVAQCGSLLRDEFVLRASG